MRKSFEVYIVSPVLLFSQAGGMDEVAFQDFERGCVTEKEPTHLPLGCSIKRLVKVSKTFPPFHAETC